jgi:hypothetical protein
MWTIEEKKFYTKVSNNLESMTKILEQMEKSLEILIEKQETILKLIIDD